MRGGGEGGGRRKQVEAKQAALGRAAARGQGTEEASEPRAAEPGRQHGRAARERLSLYISI